MPYCNPLVIDKALDWIKQNCNKAVLCSQAPSNYTEANSTYALADVPMAPSDFTLANGDVSGRKVSVAAKNGAAVYATGNPVVCALLDTVNQMLLYYTEETTAQTIYAGNTVNIPAWDIEIENPV